jgi:hypothetical protein
VQLGCGRSLGGLRLLCRFCFRAFDGTTRLAYVSTGDGKVFVFHQDSPDAYSLVQEIATHPGSKTMGYDPKTRNLIVPSSDNGAMQVLVFSAKP